ncbi:hypothetical protein [uncultured Rikenella sp.]|uniref:hypothetical protein n=1 Tax=uncultured Rikenella sp. TaxID=368003 RepID=UPI0026289743|nr:hypothetical protein [uncultured Rikenella sp.]
MNDFLFQQSRAGHFNRRPLGFLLYFAHRKTSEIPLLAGGRRIFRTFLYSRAGAIHSVSARRQQLNRLFKRRRAIRLLPRLELFLL